MIAVFDSGIGGLTVLKQLRDKHSSDYVYFGDTAHLPYGTKSSDAVRRYTLNAAIELQRRFNLSAFVIACHTASVAAADAVKKQINIPVFDMVTPLISAIQKSKARRVAILGTPGTIESGRHAELLSPYCDVIPRACPLFVPLAEEGWEDHEITTRIANEYLADLRNSVDVVILACTHYPLLRKSIASAIGENTTIIDPATILAKDIAQQLTSDSINGSVQLFASDRPYRFEELASTILKEKLQVEHLEV